MRRPVSQNTKWGLKKREENKASIYEKKKRKQTRRRKAAKKSEEKRRKAYRIIISMLTYKYLCVMAYIISLPHIFIFLVWRKENGNNNNNGALRLFRCHACCMLFDLYIWLAISQHAALWKEKKKEEGKAALKRRENMSLHIIIGIYHPCLKSRRRKKYLSSSLYIS